MSKMQSVFRFSLLVVATTAVSFASVIQGLSLKIGNETTPPGGMTQVKLRLTEPKPISTGSAGFVMDDAFFTAVDGIALHSPAGDVAGAVVITGEAYQISLTSPLASFGTNLDYPLLTLTARTRTDLKPGSQTTLGSSGSLTFNDPFGVPYPLELRTGQLTIAGGISVTDVVPGSATVPAGGEVVIRGINFTEDTRVKFSEVVLRSVRFVDSGEIRVIVDQPTRMHGMQVRVNDRAGNETTYYSYQRTKPSGISTNPLLASTVPLFATSTYTSATFAAPAASQRWFAVAAQNISPASVSVTFEALSATGAVLSANTYVLGAYERIARTTDEIASAPGAVLWRVRSTEPVQSLGLSGLDATRSVLPVTPLAVN